MQIQTPKKYRGRQRRSIIGCRRLGCMLLLLGLIAAAIGLFLNREAVAPVVESAVETAVLELNAGLGTLMAPVHKGLIDLATMVERLTAGPARVLGDAFSPYASLSPGTPADLVIFDPQARWTVDVNNFASLGRNTPLDGVELQGQVAATMVAGQLVFEERSLLQKGERT